MVEKQHRFFDLVQRLLNQTSVPYKISHSWRHEFWRQLGGGGGGAVDPTMVKGVGTQRLGKEITAKAYGSVFFSATETASSPYLVMGLC